MGAVGFVAGLSGTSATAGAEQPEPRSFIVTLRDSVADPAAVAAEHAARHDGEVNFVYRHALKGYAASFRGSGLSDLAGDARVARVEPDGVVTASATQSGATWGLDRIDQLSGTNGSFTYSNTGAGVTAYVIDTGINRTHSEFGGRAAAAGYDAFGGTGADCNGHGTHVAGTIGGATYGVAKAVNLVAVRVLDCAGSGTWSGVIAGMDWVVGSHGSGPAVANMSLGGGASTAVDAAVRRMIADGVSTAVAAGNGNQGGVAQDACKSSPARVAEAMTISATDQADRKTSWGNYGNCVDWFAPGYQITSAWHTSDTATSTISGTSMATPHTAGVAALHLQSNQAATPSAVSQALFDKTTKGVVKSSKTTKNHLLYTNY